MKTQNNNTQPQAQALSRFVQPKVFLKDEYLTLVIDGNIVIRKHVNFFKKILGVEFTPKSITQPIATQA